MSRQIKIEILGDASDAQRALKAVSDAGGHMGGALHAVSTAVGTALGGGLATAGRAVVGFVSDGMSSLANLDRIASQTEAAIKSTGGAAKLTQADIAGLGDHIEKMTGIESEQVQEGENLLLTFTEIQNRAGKGNDVFTQATGILTDMSVALGTDVKGSAVQLGKALNDPVAGISALSRVGVTFTDQQKDQIKAMTEAGDVAGAQKVILAELNKEFGGSANAFGESRAGQIAKFKNSLGDVGETIAGALLPVITKLGTFAVDHLLPAFSKVGHLFEKFGETLSGVGDKGSGLIIDIAGLFGIMEDDSRLEPFYGAMERIEDVIGVVARFVSGNFVPILAALGGVLAAVVVPPLVAAAVAAVVAAAPFIALGAVVVGLIAIWNRFPIVREIVEQVVAVVGERFAQVKAWAEEIFPQVQEAVTHVFHAIGDIISAVVAVAGAAWRLFGDDILTIGRAVFGEVQAIVAFAFGTVSAIIRFVLAVINGDWGKAWDAIKDLFSGAWHFIVETLKAAGGIISGVAGGMFDGIRHAFKAAINWIIERWNRLEFKVPEIKVGPLTFGGFTLGMPDIPYLAAGGVALGPTLAMIGEGGGPEAVVPLDRAGEFGFGGGGRGQTIVLELDGRAIARVIVPPVRDELLRVKARNGSVGFDT